MKPYSFYSETFRKVYFNFAIRVPKHIKLGVTGKGRSRGVYSLSGCMKVRCRYPGMTCARCRFSM